MQPRCLSVKADYPDDHPLTANLTVLDDVFGAADKLSLKDEGALMASLYPEALVQDTVDAVLGKSGWTAGRPPSTASSPGWTNSSPGWTAGSPRVDTQTLEL